MTSPDRLALAAQHLSNTYTQWLAYDRADAAEAEEILLQIHDEVRGAEIELEYAAAKLVDRLFDYNDVLEDSASWQARRTVAEDMYHALRRLDAALTSAEKLVKLPA